MSEAAPTDRISLSIVRPDAMPADVHKVVTDTIQGGYGGVVVAPVYVARVAAMIRNEGSQTEVATVVGFPHGTNKATLKAIEATSSIKDGAAAVHVAPHLPNLLRGDVDAARAELMEIVRAARATRRDVLIHVIIEVRMFAGSADQSQALIASACRAVRESGCDGLITVSGFNSAGAATREEIQQIRGVGEGLMIIAAGVTLDLAPAMLHAGGADRAICDQT